MEVFFEKYKFLFLIVMGKRLECFGMREGKYYFFFEDK